MASSQAPKIAAYQADAAIAKGKAVKAGASDVLGHVQVCSAATDKSFGILQSAPAAADADCEVALPGGGGKALLGGTVAVGDLLTPDTNGALVASTTENDRMIAVALQDGVSGDLIDVVINVCVG